jgi:DNA-nicking Smr family endonuclease
MSASRRGWLTEDDLRVWAEVARTTKPLRGKATPSVAEEARPPMSNVDAAEPHTKRKPAGTPHAREPRKSDAAKVPPLATLERRFVQRLRRGTAAPGAVIDLHGLRQEQAQRRLSAFLHRCRADGAKAAIVITGKGGAGDGLPGERGVLRRAVPLWLAMPELRALVIGFEEAGPGLGGSGALIVRIRAGRRRLDRE